MNSINLQFDNPLIMLLMIPAVIFALWPYLRIKKHRRRTRNRVVSMVLHIVILFLITSVFANFKIRIEDVLLEKDTILLVDVSDSSAPSKDKIDNYIETILKDYDNPNEVGIVTFGNDTDYVAKLSSNASSVYGTYKNHKVENKRDATNIQEALEECQEILGEDGGRIIVLTDGLETDGDAILAAGKLAAKKIQIDAVFFGNEPLEKEIQINSLEVEEPVKLNEETDINVYLQSASTGMATLTLYDNDEEIGKQEVFIHANETIVTFVHQFVEEGDHFLKVELELESEKDDTYAQNNKYYTFINITLDTKVLLVDGTGYETEKLYNLLNEEYDVSVVRSSNITTKIEDLVEYSEIILMNVSTETLPKGFDTVLEEYITRGGNVLTAGGLNTYYYGKMQETKFNDFLPINVVKDEENPIAVMLVIDASSSMNGTLQGSYATRMEIAVQAAIQSVNALRDIDYVGVIKFSDTAETVVPMTPVTQRASIIEKISKIQSGVGTNYVPALTLANDALIGFRDTEIRHVIFVSDGEPQDHGYNQYVSAMYEKEITTTTIGIGSNLNAGALQEMAEKGGGNYHSVTNAFELARIMVEEIENLQTDYLNDKDPVTPRIRTHTSVVKGISSLPELKGYIGATAKDEATVVLQANGDPIYAQWDYGKGTVASFMSDLKGSWTQEYFTDQRGKKFIMNMVDTLLADSSIKSEFDVTFNRENFTNYVTVNTTSKGGAKLEAKITYPDNSTEKIKLTQTAVDTYEGQIPDYGKEGLYKVELSKITASEVKTETHYTTFSYSTEYDAFFDYEESYEFMSKLVSKAKGKLYTVEDDVFSHEIIYDDININPQMGMIIFALILFLLDIAVRKFNFKWPHEIWGKKKKIEAEL